MSRRIKASAEPARQTEAQIRRKAVDGYLKRKHHHPMWADVDVLEQTGIKDRVEQMLEASGWTKLLGLVSEADVEDTSDFLATFQYFGKLNEQGFSYWHRGQRRDCSMDTLREVFDWPEGGVVYEPRGGWSAAWAVIAPTRYVSGNCHANDIPDPALFYLHHLLSKTLWARKNLDKVGQLEMSVLGMLKTGTRIHWGHYFCKHLECLRANSSIAVGGMVTYFLRRVHRMGEVATHNTLYWTKLDITYFRMGRNLEPAAGGGYQWVYYSDTSLRPPAVEQEAGPSRRRRGRDQALVIHEPQQQPQPAQQEHPAEQFPQPGMFAIDALFNSTRATILAGRPFMWAPAPPGWALGHPIPEEYLQ